MFSVRKILGFCKLHGLCFKSVKPLYFRSLGTEDFLVHKSVLYISPVNFTHNFTEISGFMCNILSIRVNLFVLCGYVLF